MNIRRAPLRLGFKRGSELKAGGEVEVLERE